MNSRYAYIKCSIPNCCEKVDYHRVKSKKKSDEYTIVWKNVCEKHRRAGIGKDLADKWKMLHGCQNSIGKYGFVCTSVIINPAQLQINHIDGDNLNRDSSNIEILCANCHTVVTQQQKHFKPYRKARNKGLANPKLFQGL